MNRHNIVYFFREGIKSIFSHGFMSLASVTVMITCLLLTGTALLLVLSVNLTIESMVTLGDIRAYVDETYTRLTNGIRDAIHPDVTLFVHYSLMDSVMMYKSSTMS